MNVNKKPHLVFNSGFWYVSWRDKIYGYGSVTVKFAWFLFCIETKQHELIK
jgi:hypothetical protein